MKEHRSLILKRSAILLSSLVLFLALSGFSYTHAQPSHHRHEKPLPAVISGLEGANLRDSLESPASVSVFVGVLVSIIILVGVIFAGWYWWLTGPSETEQLKRLRALLESMPTHELKAFIKEFMDKVSAWQGGGEPAKILRRMALDRWKEALISTDHEYIIEKFLLGLWSLDALKALAILQVFIEMTVETFLIKLPTIPGALKTLAQLMKWKKVVEIIEDLEKIQNLKEKGEKFIELQNELKRIKGELDPSQTIEGVSMGDSDSVGTTLPTSGFPVSVRGLSPIILILYFLGIVGLPAIGIFALMGGFTKTAEPTEPAPLVEEGGALVSEGDTDLVPPATPTLEPTPTPTPRPPSPIDAVFNYVPLTEGQQTQFLMAYFPDMIDDLIYSISNLTISDPLAHTNIHGSLGIMLEMYPPVVDIWFNFSLFPCDTQLEDVLTVCADGAGPMPAGDVLMLTMVLGDDVPLEDQERFYTYAAVFDADGEPSNNFRFQAPYDWDYFQGTDRWYTLDWMPQGGWALSVSDVAKGLWNAPSNARAAIMDNLVLFFIPADEFSVERPGYRLTAFGHDGMYSPARSSGDVTGADPTLPLTELYAEKLRLDSDDQGDLETVPPVQDDDQTDDQEPNQYDNLVYAFMDVLVDAMQTRDSVLLGAWLHPAVYDLYGKEACQAFLEQYGDPELEIEIQSIRGPEPWNWEIDGRSVPISDAFTLEVNMTTQGETQVQETHFALVGEDLYWFTDCGDPLP